MNMLVRSAVPPLPLPEMPPLIRAASIDSLLQAVASMGRSCEDSLSVTSLCFAPVVDCCCLNKALCGPRSPLLSACLVGYAHGSFQGASKDQRAHLGHPVTGNGWKSKGQATL